jgi:tetratricopeptide (TPR) repeat protein
MIRNSLSIAALLAIALLIFLEGFNRPGQARKNFGGSNRIVVYCAPSFDTASWNGSKAPLINGLGNLHYAVTTKSALAQKYFDQGLTLLYAFNHGEAGRSFKEVIRLDSSCAMAYWGMGMVLGPNYNAALNPASLASIHDAMNNALKYAGNASPKEKALIQALSKRFPSTEVKDMAPYNEAYAKAMQQAFAQFPDDTDIGVFYADALMNEHPWNLWLKDGTPQPWTAAIQQVLENILLKQPGHAGANHMYVHAMEASRIADKATASANRLRDMLPAAGHLVHMPAHIYIRTGQYHKGVIATEKATASDSSYIAQCKAQGSYPLLLYPHNIHFQAACSFLEGSSKKAIEAAWMVSRKADRKYLHEVVTVQHYYIIPYYVLIHLGKWDDILSLPKPEVSLKYPSAIWHYARGMAYAAKKKQAESEKELSILKQFAADGSLRNQLVWETNSVLDLINIAAYTLEAELAGYKKQYDQSTGLLQKAIEIEDKLMYQEPPDWFFSVRHTLGHILVKAQRFAEAEKIYREDLEVFPENGWALIGLYNSLKGQQKHTEAEAVKKRFDAAWQWADISIQSSRID